jgi:hypothetical protein
MWIPKLKTFVAKLGVVTVYLLFLSVQVSLQFTHSSIDLSTRTSSTWRVDHNAGKSPVAFALHTDKLDARKVLLNKRYQHESAFQLPGLMTAPQPLAHSSNINVPILPRLHSTPIPHATLQRGPPCC